MKWLPEPRLPSCSRQFGLARSALSAPSSCSSSAIRSAVRRPKMAVLYCPADSGMTLSMDSRNGAQRTALTHILRGELAPHRDHPAAGVNPNRGWNYGAKSRNY